MLVNKKHLKRLPAYLIGVLDATLILSFVYAFLAFTKKHQLFPHYFYYPSLTDFSEVIGKKTFFGGESHLHIDKNITTIEFTDEELSEAILNLNLPTWSRSYVHCSHQESEVTCSQVVLAWRTIKQWVNHMIETPLEKRRYLLVRHYYDGVGNRIAIDTTCFLLCLMDNRSLVLKGEYLKNGDMVGDKSNAYLFHPQVLQYNSTIGEILNTSSQSPPYFIQSFAQWFLSNFSEPFENGKYMDLDRLIYSSMIYTHHQTFLYTLEHFGMHAVYFLSNFLVNIPLIHINTALQILKPIPSTVNVFGVHLRLQFPGQFYSYSVESTMNKVTPFLLSKLAENPTIFSFASDNKNMEIQFSRRFRKNMIMTNAIRLPDFDHVSALLDISFLMACNECLLSFRSTFSFAIASRMGKRCWFVEKEAPSVFQATNSQAGGVSMLMHYWDVNDWQTSRRFIFVDDNEEAFRYFFNYFMF